MGSLVNPLHTPSSVLSLELSPSGHHPRGVLAIPSLSLFFFGDPIDPAMLRSWWATRVVGRGRLQGSGYNTGDGLGIAIAGIDVLRKACLDQKALLWVDLIQFNNSSPLALTQVIFAQ